jgi:outer membrane protein assembly factor BamB
VLYIGAAANTIEAFDANAVTNCSGTPKVCAPLWVGTPPQISGSQVSTPAIGNGRVYVGAPDGNMYVFDAKGVTNCAGSPKICAPLWTDETRTTGALNSSPAFDGNFVYVGSSTQDLYAFDVNGSLDCTTELPVTCAPVFTDVMFVGTSSSPAIANGLVYVGGNDGALHAFSENDFSHCVHGPNICPQVWTAAVGSSIDLSSPAVADGVVYIGGGQNIASFDATTGRSLSVVTTGGTVESSPAVANGMVYIGSGDGRLYAFGTT